MRDTQRATRTRSSRFGGKNACNTRVRMRCVCYTKRCHTFQKLCVLHRNIVHFICWVDNWHSHLDQTAPTRNPTQSRKQLPVRLATTASRVSHRLRCLPNWHNLTLRRVFAHCCNLHCINSLARPNECDTVQNIFATRPLWRRTSLGRIRLHQCRRRIRLRHLCMQSSRVTMQDMFSLHPRSPLHLNCL